MNKMTGVMFGSSIAMSLAGVMLHHSDKFYGFVIFAFMFWCLGWVIAIGRVKWVRNGS